MFIKDTIIQDWNTARKGNKNTWVVTTFETVKGTVNIKSYNTWIQRIEYSWLSYYSSSVADLPVNQIIAWLDSTLTSEL